ncbi:MAG: twin-arginine translocation signal domain-containing protein [Myxococcota bacterium]|nr:twin-arginine translocation signal domain-containing protein [Myxococcota bacterium]
MSEHEPNDASAPLTRRQALGRSAAGVAALAALLLPSAAQAHRGHRHHHDDYDDYRWRRRRRRRRRRSEWYGGYRSAAPIFFCAPCGHRFRRRHDFHSHLHHHHRVPWWRIPSLIVQAAFGWIFYGY